MKKIYISLLLSSLIIAILFYYNPFTPEIKESPEKEAKVIVKEIPLQKPAPKEPIANSETKKAKSKSSTIRTKLQSRSFIQPPLKNATIPFKKEIVSASTASILSSPKGTKIFIPKNAFVDEAGNIVKGNVDLQYREYHDHTDIFLSGIPMTYESGQLESAGMIEITASLDSKPVFINPNNKIKINIPSSNQDPGFNLYYLDMKEKKWKLREENLIPEKNIESSIESIPDQINKSSFKIQDDVYYDTYRNIPANVKNKKILLDGKSVKLIEPKSISGNYFELKVDLSKYPELSLYQNVKWQTIDSKNKRAVARIYPKKIIMVGNPAVRIVNRMGESDSFKIRIAGSTSSVDIIFLPVFEAQDMNLANRTYWKLLLSENDNAEEIAKEIIQESNRENASNLVYRSFAIDGFGTWNCDRLIGNKNSRTILATLIRSDNGEEIQTTFYLADKKTNTVYTFNPYQKSFIYDPTSNNLIWVVLDAGKLAVFNSDDLKKLDNNQKQILKMRVLDQEIKSPEDVKKILSSI